uniref:Small ribosomal subunit protein uS8c n=1 Tax=Haplomitrium blumei TaxID=258993 RepID=A0A4Y5P7R8_9MARC|nr:ribosomal protein S8 [Haplomitrium blumei]QCW59369.1 ribosomal protein S8 [Haplomitrium blumei]
MGNDTISDVITRIRNANLRGKEIVRVKATNSTKKIAEILPREGFIEGFAENERDARNLLILNLKYRGRRKRMYITTLGRISKPGSRIYSNYEEIPKVLGGMGIVIPSTSSGIMTDREARQKRIGGESLCCVW